MVEGDYTGMAKLVARHLDEASDSQDGNRDRHVGMIVAA